MNIKKIFSIFKTQLKEDTPKPLIDTSFCGLFHEVIPDILEYEKNDRIIFWNYLLDRKSIYSESNLFFLNEIFKKTSNPFPLDLITILNRYKNFSIEFQFIGLNDLNEIVLNAKNISYWNLNLQNILFTLNIHFYKFCIENSIIKNESLILRNDIKDKNNQSQKYKLQNELIQKSIQESNYNQFIIDLRESIKKLNSNEY